VNTRARRCLRPGNFYRESAVATLRKLSPLITLCVALRVTFPNSLSFSRVWWRPVSDADSGGDG